MPITGGAAMIVVACACSCKNNVVTLPAEKKKDYLPMKTWGLKFAFVFLGALLVGQGMAQTEAAAGGGRDVTTFMGIPVDGEPQDVEAKLIAKGFTPAEDIGTGFFYGEYEGEKVIVCVASNDGVVARIGVTDAVTRLEPEIKARFNALVKRYEADEGYVSFEGDNRLIDEKENVADELCNNGKVYEADFYQRPAAGNAERETVEKKFVWFKICENGGYFYIVTYFDNEYNRE